MDSASPLALMLVGQTELWDQLSRQTCTVIRQRIDLQRRVPYLDHAQTAADIQAHLTYAGTTQAIFEDSALDVPCTSRVVAHGGTARPRG